MSWFDEQKINCFFICKLHTFMIALEPTTSPCKVPIEVELFGRKNKKT